MTSLVLQNAGRPGATLLSTLLQAAQSATSGGGIFAWTNLAGLRALFTAPDFENFLARGSFDLVIGTDSITDPSALAELRRLRDLHFALTVRALVHNQSTMFHPKFAWFRSVAGTRLIVGSGNLTRGGLQANWEAHLVSDLTGANEHATLDTIQRWLADHNSLLLDLDDPVVDAAVAGNIGEERRQRSRRATPGAPSSRGVPLDVLVAELPVGRHLPTGQPGFSQANFTEQIFEDYFGGTRTQSVALLLHHVGDDGQTDTSETTTTKFKVTSINFYFEIRAAAGLVHSGITPPIAVFRRLPTGAYLYLFRLPGQPGYAQLASLLTHRVGPASPPRKRRVNVSRDDLSAVWSSSPILAPNEQPL